MKLQEITEKFKNEINQDKISASYLFYGDKRVDLLSYALMFSKMIMTKNVQNDAEKEKIEAAIKAERERIQALDKIPTLNDSQKETINKAKFEEPREPKDIMAEFFVSNANKANQEIQAAKDDILKAGLDKITPSNSDLGDNSVEDEIYKAALNAYNDEEK